MKRTYLFDEKAITINQPLSGMLKKLIVLVVLVGAGNMVFAQQDTTNIAEQKPDSTLKSDTTRITLGNREINIIESDEGTDINVRKKDREGNWDSPRKWSSERKSWRHSGGFKGHLDGIEMGYNGFLNKDMETSLTGADAFMSLNASPLKSFNLNINGLQVSRHLIGNNFGFVTGLRLEFYNYVFDGNVSIEEDGNGDIMQRFYTQELDKSKLSVSYFSIPMLLEFQFPGDFSRKKRMWLSAGIIGSIKLTSHTKVKYHEGGDRKKEKNRDDFNINVLRYHLTARMGYSDFYVYGNYSPVQFFEKNKGKGSELYPFSVGVGIHFD